MPVFKKSDKRSLKTDALLSYGYFHIFSLKRCKLCSQCANASREFKPETDVVECNEQDETERS